MARGFPATLVRPVVPSARHRCCHRRRGSATFCLVALGVPTIRCDCEETDGNQLDNQVGCAFAIYTPTSIGQLMTGSYIALIKESAPHKGCRVELHGSVLPPPAMHGESIRSIVSESQCNIQARCSEMQHHILLRQYVAQGGVYQGAIVRGF